MSAAMIGSIAKLDPLDGDPPAIPSTTPGATGLPRDDEEAPTAASPADKTEDDDSWPCPLRRVAGLLPLPSTCPSRCLDSGLRCCSNLLSDSRGVGKRVFEPAATFEILMCP